MSPGSVTGVGWHDRTIVPPPPLLARAGTARLELGAVYRHDWGPPNSADVPCTCMVWSGHCTCTSTADHCSLRPYSSSMALRALFALQVLTGCTRRLHLRGMRPSPTTLWPCFADTSASTFPRSEWFFRRHVLDSFFWLSSPFRSSGPAHTLDTSAGHSFFPRETGGSHLPSPPLVNLSFGCPNSFSPSSSPQGRLPTAQAC